MALREGERLVLPADLKEQIPWEKAEGVVVLLLMPKGEENRLVMSDVTWNEVAMLSSQLHAHVIHNLGTMKEGT